MKLVSRFSPKASGLPFASALSAISGAISGMVFLALSLTFFLPGCTYTLKLTDASFPPELKSVSIENFDNTSSFAVPGLSQRFTEAMRDKFTRETNLFVSDEPGGEWTFSGAITRYTITPIAPTGDEVTALNRLTITVSVDFENTLVEDGGWSSSFSRFADYESSSQLSDVQDGLIDDINLQLVQDVFNKVASNW